MLNSIIKKFVPLFDFLHNYSLKFLKKHNPYSYYAIPNNSKDPRFILHTGSNIINGGITNIEPWIPLFEKVGFEFIIVTRSIDVYQKLYRDYPEIGVSLISSPESLDNLIQKFQKITAFFYVANTANNNLLLRRAEGRHIFLGHGDSDKSSSMNRFFRVYDEIYVAGQAHIDRFLNADFDTSGMKFRIIGRPDTKNIFEGKFNINKIKKIIYIPTWEGYCTEQNYTSLHIFDELIEKVSKNTNLPINAKLHPITGAVKKTYLDFENKSKSNTIKNFRFIPRNIKLTEILDQESIYICDISATVSECLAFNCPIFLYIPQSKESRIVSGKIKFSDFSYTFSDLDELIKKINFVIEGNDYLREKRETAIDYFISPKAIKEQAFQKALTELSKS